MSTGSILYPVRRIPLVNIRLDGGTQVRAAMNKETVDEYAAALEEGADFPPVTVFQDYDGADIFLADGFHRFMAHQKAGLVDVLAEVVPGSRRNALFYAIGANSKHGLNRTNKDKRRAVEILLNDSEWSANSDNWIASVAGVDHKTVAKVRADLGIPKSTERTGKDGRTINTANIGRVKTASTEDAPAKTPGRAAEEKIRAATTLTELDAAYQEASRAGLSDRECEAVADARQERGAELRAQAQMTAPAPAPAAAQPAPVEVSVPVAPPAPPPTPPRGQVDLFTQPSVAVFTQEPASQPVSAETVTVSKAEWEALNAKVSAYDAWIALVDQRTYALAPTIKGEANLERIRRLIELAGSPAENEARNAAMLACRMIREQGVTLLTSDPSILDDIYGVNRRISKLAEEVGVKP